MQMKIDASKGRGDEARVERVQGERIGAGEESRAAAFGAVVCGKGGARWGQAHERRAAAVLQPRRRPGWWWSPAGDITPVARVGGSRALVGGVWRRRG